MTEILDMSRFIEAKSDQLNADDLIGNSRILTVTRVAGCDGDQPVAIYYEGDNGKPFKPCKTIRRVLMGVWGRNAHDYVGKSMQVYRDDRVTFGGLEVGGIRISHMSHIDKETTVVVMKSKGKKAGMKILPLRVEQPIRGSTAAESSGSAGKGNVDRVAAWADSFIADVEGAVDVPAVEAIVVESAATLAKIKGARPDLDKKIEEALAKARKVSDDPFGLDLIGLEGPADEQRGEAFTVDADWIIAKIEKLARASDVNGLVESHMEAIMAFEPDDKDRIVAAQLARNDAIKGVGKEGGE